MKLNDSILGILAMETFIMVNSPSMVENDWFGRIKVLHFLIRNLISFKVVSKEILKENKSFTFSYKITWVTG